ncbi:MAG TPA: amino acid adenylation domain-containing protein, partial [Polyangia bacterium]|nr:amino acid adenylation domain-containing protein [Polyangia bacterium]
FRIELGEIEARLGGLEGVKEAVVVAREHGAGDQRLVAYYTGAKTWEVTELRAALGAGLPEYMVPTAYVKLDALPLTANGKVDRRALPAPEAGAFGSGAYEPPVGPVEEALAEIWREVLRVERVGRNDNFFALGGHSLLAVTVAERMRRADLASDVRALFTAPTLAALAAQAGTAPDEIAVPPNLIPAGAETITPEMVTLVRLDQQAIDTIVAAVPGGAGNVQDIYPLAPLQEGILFHHLLQPNGDAYVLPVLLAFPTETRLLRFTAALQAVIDRHDILRTALIWDGLDEPVQVVSRRARMEIQPLALDGTEAEPDLVEALKRWIDPRRYRMDVTKAPLLRGYTAYDPRQERWLLMIVAHHLVVDHATLELLVDETLKIDRGTPVDALPAAQPFRNFVGRARLAARRDLDEVYFRKLLGDVDEPTAPFGLLESHPAGAELAQESRELPGELARAAREQARRLGVSAASVMHVAWGLVLARASGRDDVVFGTVLLGRMQGGAAAERVLGMFINTLPVRMAAGAEPVTQAVQKMHTQLAELIRHEHASLAQAQRASGVPAGTPLFGALLNYRHTQLDEAPPEHDAGDIEELWGEERSNYPLALSVDDLGERFILTAQVSRAAAGPAESAAARVCDLMERALASLVAALAEAPDASLSRLDLLPPAERDQLLSGWNQTLYPYPRESSLIELFEEQVRLAPDAIAVVQGAESFSYRELSARVEWLARALADAGVGAGSYVAVALEKSAALVLAEVAVIKAGAAYVPLDPVLPGARQALMVADCGARVLVSVAATTLPAELDEAVARGELRRVDLDTVLVPHEQASTPADCAKSAAFPRLDGGATAYVMYTSGSTGLPKGVVVPHRAVSRLVLNNGYAAFDATDRIALAANPAFDASTMEVWGALLNGGAVVVIRPEELLSPTALARALEEHRVTALFVTTALFNQYAQVIPGALARLRFLLTGGERNDPSSFARVLAAGGPAHLLHVYGPTETTTFALWHEVREVHDTARPLPLGRPIGNTQVYVLDRHRQPAPVGVPGELYIGGDGVALGYLNRPELTAERFVDDSLLGRSGGRLYRTGDIGRWLPDGTIEYIGRNDFQVKIRGFRIELGEIEARLAALQDVAEVVVVAREEPLGEKRLVAYYVGAPAPDVLRAHLRGELPEYMIPAAYVRLPGFPLTANGKIDRRALPAPDAEAFPARVYEAPNGPVEEALAGIWRELLNLERVGRNDHFFELGGHSLLAMQLVSRVQSTLGASLDLVELFSHPVLADLAIRVAQAKTKELQPIRVLARRGSR